MAAKNNESFWRLFLLLNEGCPLVSRQLISKEIAKSGYDLDRLLFDNKKQLLEGKFGLGNADIEILFPENKKTDIKHWDAHLFPCVILTLFSKSIHTNERQNMRSILHLHKDIEGSLPEASLDPETYDEYKETLCEALRSLAHSLSEPVENEITDLINVLTTQSLNLQAITGTVLPAEIKEKLLHFLEMFPSYSETIHSEGLPPQLIANTNECNKNPTILEKIKTNVIYERVQAEHSLADENTCIDVHETQECEQGSTESMLELKLNDNTEFHNEGIPDRPCDGENGTEGFENQSEETASEADCLGSEDAMTGLDKGSEGIATEEECLGSEDYITELEKGSEEIVTNASKPMTEGERKNIELFWKDKDFEQAVDNKSFAEVCDKKMAEWEHEDVNVAVLGHTGVGKSSFINAFRCCLSSEDSSFAPVGSDETTTEAKAYPHPRNKRLILWDLPGMGTKTFSRKTYVKDKKVSFQDYHIYLIMASDRFMEDEIYLAEEIEKIGKTFLFVRTRVDINLDGVDDVKGEIKRIRDNCRKNLADFASNEVYLISSKKVEHQDLDFEQLFERLVMSLDGLKKEMILYSLQFNTKTFIESKATALQSRIKYVSLKSAIGGCIPIPGVSLLVDWVLISKELDFYRKTLGVSEGDLKVLAEKTKTHVEILKTKHKLRSFNLYKLTSKRDTVIKFEGQYVPIWQRIATSEAAESTSKLVPVVGPVVGAGKYFGTTYHFLKLNLEMMVQDAKKMLSIYLEETGSKVLPLNKNYIS